MEIKAQLSDFKKKVDREIDIFFAKTIKETQKRDLIIADALRYSKKAVLSGGKRLRPAIMYYGYIGAGGKDYERIIRTSASIELIHAFLLMHDDIIDRDRTRHGIDTINVYFEKIGKRIFRTSDYVHFGNSMGIIIGDMIGALGSQIIFDSGFKPELVMKALSRLQSIVSYTVIGQSKDIYMEYKKNATEKEILSMYEHKTAKYTIEGPLHLGLILGGDSEQLANSLSRYAIPIGIAFQIQDDILGAFGSEKKLGKAIGSDIKEGKQTLLLAKARELANRQQRKELESLLFQDKITKSEIAKFQTLLLDTGALDYARDMATGLIRKGKQELARIDLAPEAKDFLNGLADYMIKRDV